MATRTRRQFLRQSAAGLAAAGATAASGSLHTSVAARSQDRVAGANRRVRVGLIGCGGMGNGDLRDMLCARRAMRRALRRGRRAGHQDGERVSKDVQADARPDHARLPQGARSQGHRRGDRRHAGSLARAADDHGLPGRQGRLRREAAVAHDRRRPRDGRRRAPPQPRRADGHAAAERDAFRRRRRVREERRARQDPRREDLGVPGLDGQHPARARQRAAADGGLRHVARPGAEAAVQQEPVPLQFPLVLRLLGRPDDRLGRAHDRHRELGHGREGAEGGDVGRRQVRLSRRCRGDAGHAAGAAGSTTASA